MGRPYLGGWTSEKEREYERRRVVCTSRNGVQYVLIGNKRERPKDGKCELCTDIPKRLAYHHWDDKNLKKAIWCCPRCHHILNSIEYPIQLLKAICLRIKRSL